MTSLAEQLNAQDFYHPFMIIDGRVTNAPRGVYVPSVMHDDEHDILIDGLRERDSEWSAISGFTGQWSYHGSVMHPSEYVGNRMAEHLAEITEDEPYVFVFVPVDVEPDDEDDAPEPAGWTVLYAPYVKLSE